MQILIIYQILMHIHKIRVNKIVMDYFSLL